MRAVKAIFHGVGYAVGVAGLIVISIADDISTRRRNKSGANRRIDG